MTTNDRELSDEQIDRIFHDNPPEQGEGHGTFIDNVRAVIAADRSLRMEAAPERARLVEDAKHIIGDCIASGSRGAVARANQVIDRLAALPAPTPQAEFRKEVERISGDYIPDRDSEAPLALGEMRDALLSALAAAAAAPTPVPESWQAERSRLYAEIEELKGLANSAAKWRGMAQAKGLAPASVQPVAWEWRKRVMWFEGTSDETSFWMDWEPLVPPYMDVRALAKTDPANYEVRALGVIDPTPAESGDAAIDSRWYIGAPKANLYHDAGAFAQCHYCKRYSLNARTLTDRPPACDCGNKDGWSGSFQQPTSDAKWSGLAAPAPQAAAAEEPGNTLENNVRYLLDHTPPQFLVRAKYKGRDEDIVGSLAITYRKMQDAALAAPAAEAPRSEWPIKPLEKVQVRMADGTHVMLRPVFPVFDAASMQELEDRLTKPAAEAGRDALDAKRWRWLGRHWATADLRFDTKAPGNPPKSISITARVSVPYADPTQINEFVDAALAGTPGAQEQQP